MLVFKRIPTRGKGPECLSEEKKKKKVIPWLVYDEMDVSRDAKLILIAFRTVGSVSGESGIYEVEW